MGVAWPEKSYQLEAKEWQKLNPDEQKALSDINNFLKWKNYTEGKNIVVKKELDNKNTDDPAVKNVQEKYENLKNKVKEKQTTVTNEVNKTQGVTIQRPMPWTEIRTEKTEKSTQDQMENVGQTKGKVEYLDKEQIAAIVTKIKDNMNDKNFSLAIIWRSDANVFVEWPTAKELKQKYNILTKGLRNDLPNSAKEKFTVPSRPENSTKEQISDWLNVLLAQTRALQALSDIRNQIGVQDFKKVMEKWNTEFIIQAHMPTLEWEDRGASVICKNTNKVENSTTIPPVKLPETKEIIKDKEHFELYQSVKFSTPDGKVFYKMFKRAMMIETKPGKESTLIPKWWTTVWMQRNSEGKIIPSNQETAGYAKKYPDKYGAPDMQYVANADITQKSAVLEKTITKNTDGSIVTSEEYTTSSPSKILLPEVAYNLTEEETKNNVYDKTASTIIPYLEKTYPITKPSDLKKTNQKPSFTQ